MNTTRKIYNTGRKVVLLSAAFFALVITASSCKKERNPVGSDALPQDLLMNSKGIDTFSLITYSELEDSVVSMDAQFNLLGSYVDPEVGQVEAGFYTQLSLSGFSPDFGNLNELSIDSCVLAFEYGGYYGSLSEQLFEVYEIADDLSRDSTYYNYSSVQTEFEQLVPTLNNEGSITPNPLVRSVVGEDTLNPQLRIPLDTVFARDLLELASNSTDDEAFLDEMKGLYIKVNNTSQSIGDGGILYLSSTSAASKMTVYYTINGEQEEFDFLIVNNAIDFNKVSFDYSNTNVEQLIADSTFGQNTYYAQSFSMRGKIDIPSLGNLPKDVIVHEATLELPISYYTGGDFYPSSEITVSSRLFDGDDTKYIIDGNVSFNQSSKSYRINLRRYVQNLLNDEIQNNGLFVAPALFNSTAERILFNGPTSLNKKQPKLTIVYTKL
jgi:hypothetical protein